MAFDRWKMHAAVSVLAVSAMALALTPAVADPLPGTDTYPEVAFLARNDVPFDAQTAASMAAQLGAPIFITNPSVLADAARDGIADLNPDVIIVAGGVFAISDDVAGDAAAVCDPDCTVDRRFGSGRDETAAALAQVAADYGFQRPVLQGDGQVVGDVRVGGTVHTDSLTVQDTQQVAGLNADRLDGRHADAFALSDRACSAGEVVTGIGADGTPTCTGSVDADTIDGTDSDELLRLPVTVSQQLAVYPYSAETSIDLIHFAGTTMVVPTATGNRSVLVQIPGSIADPAGEVRVTALTICYSVRDGADAISRVTLWSGSAVTAAIQSDDVTWNSTTPGTCETLPVATDSTATAGTSIGVILTYSATGTGSTHGLRITDVAVTYDRGSSAASTAAGAADTTSGGAPQERD